MRDKCPYCEKSNCIPEVAYINCETYGNNFFTVKCNYCGKILDIQINRTVKLEDIIKSNKRADETDW